ncbi:MAG TPA: hypothetical protein VLW55_12645 [Burkholderiaceae bacterium]|nr:hypothetical protein [Burkholderiaceae bacterium]
MLTTNNSTPATVVGAPVNLLYRASVRRIPRVRLFIDFVVERFREIEIERGQQVMASEAPPWLWRRLGRASAVVNRRA